MRSIRVVYKTKYVKNLQNNKIRKLRIQFPQVTHPILFQ